MPLQRFVPLVLALALAGCGSVGAIGLGPMPKNGQVETAGGLPPAMPSDPGASGGHPASRAVPVPSDQVAAAGGDAGAAAVPAAGGAAAAGSGGLGRTDLLGGWTISSAGDSCQLFMTLTTWTGGYRASTRGCSSGVLKSISAWNLEGKQVVLAGTGGTPVARLSSAGNNRFDGRTETGTVPVTFYR